MLSNRVKSRDLVTANAGFVIIFVVKPVWANSGRHLVDMSFQFGFSVLLLLGLTYAGIY